MFSSRGTVTIIMNCTHVKDLLTRIFTLQFTSSQRRNIQQRVYISFLFVVFIHTYFMIKSIYINTLSQGAQSSFKWVSRKTVWKSNIDMSTYTQPTKSLSSLVYYLPITKNVSTTAPHLWIWTNLDSQQKRRSVCSQLFLQR